MLILSGFLGNKCYSLHSYSSDTKGTKSSFSLALTYFYFAIILCRRCVPMLIWRSQLQPKPPETTTTTPTLPAHPCSDSKAQTWGTSYYKMVALMSTTLILACFTISFKTCFEILGFSVTEITSLKSEDPYNIVRSWSSLNICVI